jgi:[CysO sulfur-carrier protein]-S-L-cysteine hydrolase
VRIAREVIDSVVAHARDEAPNECCGMLAADDGAAVTVFPVTNIHASPLRYEMDPKEMYDALRTIEDRGLALGATYHSHTRSAPVPSQTDINLSTLWPETPLVIVGLAAEAPEIRAWRLEDGAAVELPLEVG